jgi:hypothetical protein
VVGCMFLHAGAATRGKLRKVPSRRLVSTPYGGWDGVEAVRRAGTRLEVFLQ